MTPLNTEHANFNNTTSSSQGQLTPTSVSTFEDPTLSGTLAAARAHFPATTGERGFASSAAAAAARMEDDAIEVDVDVDADGEVGAPSSRSETEKTPAPGSPVPVSSPGGVWPVLPTVMNSANNKPSEDASSSPNSPVMDDLGWF